MMTELEEKLKRVKTILKNRMRKEGAEEWAYHHLVRDLLFEEKILEGEKSDNCLVELAIRMSVDFQNKLELKKFSGLNYDYLSIDKNLLSEKEQYDIKQYEILESDCLSYLKKEIGDKPVFKKDLKKEVEKFVKSRIPILEIYRERLYDPIQDAIIKITESLTYGKNHFRILQEPKKVGNYFKEPFIEAMGRI